MRSGDDGHGPARCEERVGGAVAAMTLGAPVVVVSWVPSWTLPRGGVRCLEKCWSRARCEDPLLLEACS